MFIRSTHVLVRSPGPVPDAAPGVRLIVLIHKFDILLCRSLAVALLQLFPAFVLLSLAALGCPRAPPDSPSMGAHLLRLSSARSKFLQCKERHRASVALSLALAVYSKGPACLQRTVSSDTQDQSATVHRRQFLWAQQGGSG